MFFTLVKHELRPRIRCVCQVIQEKIDSHEDKKAAAWKQLPLHS